jgi:hypothetical protein
MFQVLIAISRAEYNAAGLGIGVTSQVLNFSYKEQAESFIEKCLAGNKESSFSTQTWRLYT